MTLNSPEYWMSKAIECAKKGLYTTRPNPAVGAVIVYNNQIVSEGFHAKSGEAHAEINALNNLSKDINPKNCILYITLEPCSHTGKTGPCTKAIIESGIQSIMIAGLDPNPLVSGKGVKVLKQAGLKIKSGILKTEAEALNPGFLYAMQNQKPYVRCKMGMSLDGRVALNNGQSKWITNSKSREDVHHLRAQSGAIITGSGSVLSDDPLLTARINQPTAPILKIIVDRRFRVPISSKIFESAINKSSDIWWVGDLKQISPQQKSFVEQNKQIKLKQYTNLSDLLNLLYQNQIYDVLVESGPVFSGACLDENIINELWIYQAPKLLGDKAQGVFNLSELNNIKNSKHLKLKNIKQIEGDVRLIFEIKK